MYYRLQERNGSEREDKHGEKGIRGRRRRKYNFLNIVESENTSVGPGEGTEE